MTLSIKIKGPKGSNTEATLTNDQFKLVEPIIVDMMNDVVSRREAEKRILRCLEENGIPAVFLDVQEA
jgi:hypothetical protein